MAKKKVQQKIGIGDLVSLAKSGWTPGEVNALLDRMDEVGDINDPIDPDDADDNEDDEDDQTEDNDQDEPDEDEDDNVSDDDNEEDDTDASNDTKNKKKDINKQHSLEVENTRLKKQIEKLQKKNRNKDISGGDDDVPIEKSLINLFQSKFD